MPLDESSIENSIYSPVFDKAKIRSVIESADNGYSSELSENEEIVLKNSPFIDDRTFKRERAIVNSIAEIADQHEEDFKEPLKKISFTTEAILLHHALSTKKFGAICSEYLDHFSLTKEEYVRLKIEKYLDDYNHTSGLQMTEESKAMLLKSWEKSVDYELQADAFFHYLENEMPNIAKSEEAYKKFGISVGYELEYLDIDRMQNLEAEDLPLMDDNFYSISIHLSRLNAHKDIKNYEQESIKVEPTAIEGREIVSEPTYSFRTQFLRYIRMQEIYNENTEFVWHLDKHITVGGVELSLDRNMIMYARAMLYSCGMALPRRKVEKQVFREAFQRTAEAVDGSIVYFPFHAPRIYKSVSDPSKETPAVEFRSFPRFRNGSEEEKFGDLVNEMKTSEYLTNFSLGESVWSKYKNGENLDPMESKVAAIYIKHVLEWFKLVEKSGIHVPRGKEMYVKINDPAYYESLSQKEKSNLLTHNAYSYFLTDLSNASYQDELFRKSANELRIDFNKKIKEAIGLG